MAWIGLIPAPIDPQHRLDPFDHKVYFQISSHTLASWYPATACAIDRRGNNLER